MNTIAIRKNDTNVNTSSDFENLSQKRNKTSLSNVFDVSISEATFEFSKEMQRYTIQCFNTHS
ncbi:hypothetical protein [Aquimarina celericrescens]|uniref:Uncharacterized protein n=1 Tax=Aquimarina celericrescens TaxID=1964542 RepID=A0ABW5B2L0_9FLAO|nr:hypothetical protein [Aquimarina celericrescens]